MIQPIYRYHAVQQDGYRFYYSTNQMQGDGWIFDGIAFRTPTDDPNAVPVNRFHHDQSKTYGGWRFHYSTSMKPAQNDWIYDGVRFHAFDHSNDLTVPVYQYSCQQTDGFRFFFSTGENHQNDGWTKDGIAFWAYPGDLN